MKKTQTQRSIILFSLIGCLAGVMPYAHAVEVLEGENPLNVNGQLQVHGVMESVDDPYSSDNRFYLFLRQARLSVNGELNGTKYEIEWMLGGEEVPERNSVMSLLDAYADTPLTDTVRLKIGQFKVPYGRERLIDSGVAFNVERSIANNWFNIGRDVGAAVYTQEGTLAAGAGLFTGGGINIPERYLPEDIGIPMLVARVGVNDGLDQDVFTPVNANAAPGSEGFAAYLNGMYNEDSRVGHSTPLNVKYYDKSLMLNSDWNPYVKAYGEKSEFYQVGGDVALMTALSDKSSLLLSAEANFSHLSNKSGTIESYGGLVSANVITEGMTYGIRYAIVNPDEETAYTDDDRVRYPLTDDTIQEITGSIVYFVPDTGFKVIAELTYQIDVPVAIEGGNGVYNLMRQPDQVSYAAGEGIDFQDNITAHLIVQYNF